MWYSVASDQTAPNPVLTVYTIKILIIGTFEAIIVIVQKMKEFALTMVYSENSTNGHLSTTVTCLQQPVFNISKVQFNYTFDLSLSTVVTSLQQPLLCFPMGGCCRGCIVFPKDPDRMLYNTDPDKYNTDPDKNAPLWAVWS